MAAVAFAAAPAAAAAALTTPFAGPTSCLDNFSATITHGDSIGTTYTYLASVTGSAFNCQPTATAQGARSLTFSPAVCPSDWVAYGLGVSNTNAAGFSRDITFSATCCSSGFTPAGVVDGLSTFGEDVGACTKPVSETQNVVANTTQYSTVVSAHAAWQVQWMYSDTSTLSPAPPSLSLCSQVQIPTWTPGAKVAKADRNKECRELGNSPDERENNLGAVYAGVIGGSVGGFVLLLVVGIICCVCFRRRNRKKKLRKEEIKRRSIPLRPTTVHDIEPGMVKSPEA